RGAIVPSGSDSGHRLPMQLDTLDSPLGPLLAVADDEAIRALEFVKPAGAVPQLEAMQAALGTTLERGTHPLLERLRSRLAEYFAGTRREFDVPLRFTGTPFQER